MDNIELYGLANLVWQYEYEYGFVGRGYEYGFGPANSAIVYDTSAPKCSYELIITKVN